MRTKQEQRGGFTLVEILVVVAIVAILVALTAAGTFQVIESQRQSNTQNAMSTVIKVLQRQMKAVVDKADKETIPPKVVTYMAGNDMRRARVIWKKLRLKQEFPMTFFEALNPYKSYAGNPVFLDAANSVMLDSTDLPPIATYKSNPTVAAGTLPISDASQRCVVESSVCLLLALKQNRGGVSLSPDELGSSAIDSYEEYDFDPVKNKKTGYHAKISTGSKYLADGWGYPIAFFRSPTGYLELDNSNPGMQPYDPNPATGTKTWLRDPLDSEGTLISPYWNNTSPTPATNAFELLCHPIHSGPTYKARAWYVLPVLASAGRNGLWGLKDRSVPPANPDYDDTFSMTPAATNSANEYDNIYSFRLREGIRGD